MQNVIDSRPIMWGRGELRSAQGLSRFLKSPSFASRLRTRRRYATGLWSLLAATTVMIMMLAGCGGSGASGGSQQSAMLSGNWQFAMTNPDPTYPAGFQYGLQGGFLLQNNGVVTGQAVYSVAGPVAGTQPPEWEVCNSGSATITGTISGQTLSLTAAAGSQTFALTGTLGSGGSIANPTFTTAGGMAAGFTTCGIPTPNTGGLPWSATSVPPLTGAITGSFHSTSGNSGLADQDFPVSGFLTQGQNIGASNATVTGTLTFINLETNLSVYPCFSTASVNGQISGNSVILQIIGTNGATVGQIGASAGSSTGVNPVAFNSAQGGYVLNGTGPSYMVATSACPGSLLGTVSAGDFGNVCLALNSTTPCQEPILLTPAFINFPPQALGVAGASTQTITLGNNSGSVLDGLALQWLVNDGSFGSPSDFNGQPNFGEQDTCASPFGSTFSLNAGASCTITVSFTPEEGCPWIPYTFGSLPIDGIAPEFCPLPLGATLTAVTKTSPDGETSFAVPITGIGLSALQPSTPELDFGAEEQFSPPEASVPQMLSFTNTSSNDVQILSNAPCLNQSALSHTHLPAPRQASPVAGLQVVSNDVYQIQADPNTSPFTVTYRCDSDPGTFLPNFQISSDTCTGSNLSPQASCSVEIAYVPQPNTSITAGLDYFLELNTLQCYGSQTTDCEIDSGRFPVELKANGPSPLRMTPSAGLDFGFQKKGTTSAPMTITLLNDPNLTNTETVTFVGKIAVSGNFSELDNCPATLAPGSGCTLSITFTPSGTGLEHGQLTINYLPEPNGSFQQFIYLRGTGQ
jgi:hypothetical protein